MGLETRSTEIESDGSKKENQESSDDKEKSEVKESKKDKVEKQRHLNFSDTENLFSQLKDTGIDKGKFISKFNSLNGEQKDFFQSLYNVISGTKINDTNTIFSIMSYCSDLGNLSKKNFLLKIAKMNPKKILSQLNEKITKKEEIENTNDSKKKALETKSQESKEKENTLDEQVSDVVKNIKEKIGKQVPELQTKIEETISEVKKQFPKATNDQAYLLAFDHISKQNPEISAKIQLDQKSLNIIQNTVNKFGSLNVGKIISSKAVNNEIKDFVNTKTKYDETISASLDTENVNFEKLDNSEQLKIFEKYQDLVNNFLEKSNSDIKNFDSLRKELLNPKNQDNPEIQNLVKQLNQLVVSNYTQEYTMDYKQTAITEYTKSIFTILEQSIGIRNLQENFTSSGEKFNINNGEINLNFNYESTPINLQIKDGNVYMTSLLGRENQDPNALEQSQSGVFQKQQTKVNHLFTFPNLNDVLSAQNRQLETQDLLKGPDSTKQISDKMKSLNGLGNKNLMQNELNTHLKEQKLVSNILNAYQPQEQAQRFLDGTEKIGENSPLHKIMTSLDKTLQIDPNALNNLNNSFDNPEFNKFIRNNLRGNSSEYIGDLYDFLQKGRFIDQNGILKSTAIQELSKDIADCSNKMKMQEQSKTENQNN